MKKSRANQQVQDWNPTRNQPQQEVLPPQRQREDAFEITEDAQEILTLYNLYNAFQTEQRRRVMEAQSLQMMQRMQVEYERKRRDDAALGTVENAEQAGMLKPGRLYLGVLDGRLLFYDGEGTLLTYGAARSGKFRDIIAPNLVHSAGSKRHSVVMTDPKGEGAYATGAYRARLQGSEPGYVNPWGMGGLPHHRMNPLQYLIDAAARGEEVIDQAWTAVEMLFPHSPSEEKGETKWIADAAKDLFHFSIVHLAEKEPENCTLGHLWDIATATRDETKTRLEAMYQAAEPDGFVERKVIKFRDSYLSDEMTKQLAWVVEKAEKAVHLFARGAVLRDAVAATDFHPARLKQRPSTLYLMVPGQFLTSHGKWLAMLTHSIIESVAHAPGDMRTTFILDEFGNLPAIPAVIKGMLVYGSKGVQVWPFLQGRYSLDEIYGPAGRKLFEDQAHIHQMWGVEDPDLQKQIEARAGTRAVIPNNMNISTNLQGDGSGYSIGEQTAPLLSAAEIVRIGSGRQILRVRDQPLFVAERHPWWMFENWCDAVRDHHKYPCEGIG